ncbi:hypothetical protein SH139x_003397 [Planctomycetaceae bacterium SH139]
MHSNTPSQTQGIGLTFTSGGRVCQLGEFLWDLREAFPTRTFPRLAATNVGNGLPCPALAILLHP